MWIRIYHHRTPVANVREISGWVCGEQQHTKQINDETVRSMLNEFVVLDETSEAALDFVSKHGVLDHVDWDMPKAVRTFVNKCRREGRPAHVMALKRFWGKRSELKDLLRIIGIAKSGKPGAEERARKAAVEIVYLRPIPFLRERIRQKDRGPEATRFYKDQLARMKLLSRLVDYRTAMSGLLFFGDATLSVHNLTEPVIHAHTMRSCFYLYIWMGLVGKAPPTICPNCHRVFEIRRPRQQWCSERCRQAHKQRERRARKKKAK